jgi:spore coat polysaccharide biosynthesis protein SpsF
MTIAVIVQARMGSTRLPGKVMRTLSGMPVLWHIIQRVKCAELPDKILIATTTNPEDILIVSACKKWNVPVFRGDPEDVLKRYYDGLVFLETECKTIDFIVRITADCPLIDPELIDKEIQIAITGKYDYVSNVDPPTYPDGLDVEVLSRAALLKAYKNASLPSEHKHVTPYILKNPLFNKFNLRNSDDLSAMRWTLDNEEDFLFIKSIYEALYQPSGIFTTSEVLIFLRDHPEIQNINTDIRRNEGYAKSLREDTENLRVKK